MIGWGYSHALSRSDAVRALDVSVREEFFSAAMEPNSRSIEWSTVWIAVHLVLLLGA